MKRYKVFLEIRGLPEETKEFDIFTECENYVLSRPYERFEVYRDGTLISNREYNY